MYAAVAVTATTAARSGSYQSRPPVPPGVVHGKDGTIGKERQVAGKQISLRLLCGTGRLCDNGWKAIPIGTAGQDLAESTEYPLVALTQLRSEAFGRPPLKETCPLWIPFSSSAAAIGGTLLLCQALLTAVGLGGHHDFFAHGDHDFGSHEPGHDHESSWFAGLVTFRTIVAALTFFGLAGMTAIAGNAQPPLALAIATAAGVALWCWWPS